MSAGEREGLVILVVRLVLVVLHLHERHPERFDSRYGRVGGGLDLVGNILKSVTTQLPLIPRFQMKHGLLIYLGHFFAEEELDLILIGGG